MAQYIEKAAVVAEINRVVGSYDPTNEITSGRYAFVRLRNFLDTLEVKEVQEEPVREDLEEAAILYAKKEYNKKNPSSLPPKCKGCYAPLMYAFKAGAKWQMAQTMKDSIDVTIHIDAGGYPYIPQMELYDYDKDMPLAKEGDRYKVVLLRRNNIGTAEKNLYKEYQKNAQRNGCKTTHRRRISKSNKTV